MKIRWFPGTYSYHGTRGTPHFVTMAALVLTTALMSALAPPTVVVTGATGRVGRLVVQRLLQREGTATTVRAVVRDGAKALEVLPRDGRIELVFCDLASDDCAAAIKRMCEGADAVIWCASGFKPDGTLIDIDGVTEFAKAFDNGNASGIAPKVVLCSSAGVSRPQWSEEKKKKLVGAADIPIIRLNPGAILDKKMVAEAKLREGGAPYCIVRPTGLKDTWPAGRPILSQGDVAVGRTNPDDLAEVLVSCLEEPHAAGKTFEMFTMTGYPAGALGTALEALASDKAPPSEAAVEASYRVLQQMLPGEQQDATKLEMGRTYEEVDAGKVGRKRGAAPTERELSVAQGALTSMGGAPATPMPGFLRRLFRRSSS